MMRSARSSQLRGVETARLFQQSQEAAVARIEENVDALSISCNFRRLDAFLFPAMGMETKEARDQCDKEYAAARKVGAAAEKTKGVPLKGFEDAPVLRYPDQATFHPLKYLAGLAAAIRAKGGRIFANSAVTKIEERQSGIRLSVDGGGTIDAGTAVFATNSPINDRAGAAQQDGALPHLRHGLHAGARHAARRALLGHGRPLSLRAAQSGAGLDRLSDCRRR